MLSKALLTFMLLSKPAMAAELSGAVKIDGSSTVYPITEAVAEEFQKANPKVKVTVGVSGTGGGMKKFVTGELDIADASRPVREDEAKKAKEAGIEFMELAVGYDGLSVVVNPKNTWVKTLTKEQLKKLWEPGSKVKTWKDLDPSWPAQEIHLYGPGADSGTFEFFTETVVGKAKSSRSDYTASEDDNVLVNGIAGDVNALGYFGYAYVAENQKRLTPVPLDFGKGAVAVKEAAILDGSYPLARPLFIVVNKKAAERPEVDAFARFYLKSAKEMAKAVGYTSLPQAMTDDAQKRYDTKRTGNWGGAKAAH